MQSLNPTNQVLPNQASVEVADLSTRFSWLECLKQCLLMASVFTLSLVALVAIELDQVPWQIQWFEHASLGLQVQSALDNLLFESLILLFVASSFATLSLYTVRQVQYQSINRDPDQFYGWEKSDLSLLEHRVDRFKPLADPNSEESLESSRDKDGAADKDLSVHQWAGGDRTVHKSDVALQLEIALKEIERLRCESKSYQEQLDQANQEIARMVSSRQSDYLMMNVSRLPNRRVAGATDPSLTLNRRQSDPVLHPHRNRK